MSRHDAYLFPAFDLPHTMKYVYIDFEWASCVSTPIKTLALRYTLRDDGGKRDTDRVVLDIHEDT